MAKAVKYSEIASEIKKEYLKEHLENARRLIGDWIKELNAPLLFAPQKEIWGWQSVYKPSIECDPDSNHILRRHLRSRALWSHHAEWDLKLEGAWCLATQVRVEAHKKQAKQLVKKKRQYTEAYISTALWQGFEVACGTALKINYRIPEHQKGISFGAYNIEASVTSAKERVLVEKEHRKFSYELAEVGAMKELVGLWSEVGRIQKVMHNIATKVQKSNDILYPCRFCKHLWK